MKDIVLGRYIFVFVNYLASFLAIVVVNFGFVLYRNTAFSTLDIMLAFSLSFLVFSVITGIQMPLFFKIGYTKAKVWSLVPFSAVMVLVAIPVFVPALSGIIELMQSRKGVFVVGGILSSCAIQLISYRVAVILYRKRK